MSKYAGTEGNGLHVDIEHSTMEPNAHTHTHTHTEMQERKVFGGGGGRFCQNGNKYIRNTHRFITNFSVYKLFFVFVFICSGVAREMWTSSVHLGPSMVNSRGGGGASTWECVRHTSNSRTNAQQRTAVAGATATRTAKAAQAEMQYPELYGGGAQYSLRVLPTFRISDYCFVDIGRSPNVYASFIYMIILAF